MTTAFVCVFAAFVLLYLPKLAVAVGMARQPEGYDNRHPRTQQAQLKGWTGRAVAAQLNGFENFPGFAAAVVIAHLTGVDEHRAAVLAITYVVARVLYVAAYMANLDYLRSGVWGVGLLATGALFVLPLLA